MRVALAAIACAAGCAAARPPCAALELGLRLPFAGEARTVGQGNDGRFSHQDRYRWAWDFVMPEGTEVAAAADGVVVEVIDRFTEGGVDPALKDRANRVVLDHGGARFSIYQHLRAGGVLVKEGDRVTRGQALALSGNTGYSTGPHLHFAVVDELNRSLPVCFAGVPGGVPVEGRRYSSLPEPRPPSTLPRDVFARNGAVLLDDLPARRFVGRMVVAGRALRPARRAVTLLFARDGRSEPRAFFGDVGGDGVFHITVDAAALAGLPGELKLAVALVEPDGTYRTDYWVPIVFR